jgi:hypothetical protein
MTENFNASLVPGHATYEGTRHYSNFGSGGHERVDHVRANLRILAEPRATGEQFVRLFARGQENF